VRLTVTAFLSLDGVMQAPGEPGEDRSGGFDQGGWTFPYADEDSGRLLVERISAADAFLLGRRTYEIFAAHWPRVTDPNDPLAARLNQRPKYVASRTLSTVDWDNSKLLEGDVAEAVAELKRQPGNELQVHGSGELARTLMEHDLVDEYHLWLYPVVLGRGKRLFGDGGAPHAMRLTDTRATRAGVAIHTYQAAGKPTYGSFALDDQ
jgi:dihydrofolate reductase